MKPTTLLVWLALLPGAAGCHGGEVAPDAGQGEPDALPARGRVDVSPAAALLTTPGAGGAFRAEAFDPDGQPMSGAVRWSSSNPDVVSIDAEGRVTAQAAIGSAQITATVGDVVSPPVLVLVAEPVPGAVLVADDQVLAGPTPVDPAAPLDLGFRLGLTLAPGISVSPGAILLSREGKSVAGRVVSAEPGAAGIDVVLEIVALPELFRRLEVDDSYRIDAHTLAEEPEGAGAGAAATPQDEGTFMIGPLKCKKPSASFGALTGNATIRLEPDVTLVRHLAHDTEGEVTVATVMVTGTLKATGTLSLTFSPSITGKVTCTYTVKRIPLPIAGPVSVVAGLQVPIGLKGEIAFGLVATQVEAVLEIRATSQTTMGFSYTPETGLVPVATMTQDVDVKPKLNLTNSGLAPVATIAVAVGPTAGLDVGINLPLLGGASLSLLEAWLQLKADATLTLPIIQLAEPTLAAKYGAKVGLKVGPGSDAKKALSFLGGAVTINPELSIERKLATSPVGTMTPNRTEAQPGDAAELRVGLDADTTSFLGLANVQEIRIYHAAPGGEEPEVIATLPGNPQATFTWNPTITDIGTHVFWATVVTVLAPGLPLEIKDDSSVLIHVGPRMFGPWHGQISWEASGEETSESGQYRYQWNLAASGTSMVRQVEATPEFLEETSATGSVDHVEVSTFTPEPDPDDCRYRRVTTTTTSGSQLAADQDFPRAQLAISDVSGVYQLYFLTPELATTYQGETVSSKVSGPATCEPGGTTTTGPFPSTFQPEDIVGMGTFAPGATTISGSATIMTGSSPLSTYTLTWTLSR